MGVDAQGLTHHLATASSTWKAMIRLAHLAEAQDDCAFSVLCQIPKAAPRATYAVPKNPSLEQQVRSLMRIGGQYAASFQRHSRTLLSSISRRGSASMSCTRCYPNILDQVRAAGKSVFEPESYQDLVGKALLSVEAHWRRRHGDWRRFCSGRDGRWPTSRQSCQIRFSRGGRNDLSRGLPGGVRRQPSHSPGSP